MAPVSEPRPVCHQDCPSWTSDDPVRVCECDRIRTPELRLPTRAELRHIPLTACQLDDDDLQEGQEPIELRPLPAEAGQR